MHYCAFCIIYAIERPIIESIYTQSSCIARFVLVDLLNQGLLSTLNYSTLCGFFKKKKQKKKHLHHIQYEYDVYCEYEHNTRQSYRATGFALRLFAKRVFNTRHVIFQMHKSRCLRSVCFLKPYSRRNRLVWLMHSRLDAVRAVINKHTHAHKTSRLIYHARIVIQT